MAGRKIGEAFVAVKPEVDKGFGSDLDRSVVGRAGASGSKAGKGFGASFKSGLTPILAGVGGLFAAAGVAKFFKGTIAEATEAQKVGAQTAAVLKSTGGAANISAAAIGNLATAISNKTGIDDEAIQSNENLLLTFTNVRNEVGKGNDVFNQATQAVTDMSAALGQDGKSSAIQLGKALNDPIKGITALSRVGVSFTAQQKEQIATLVKSGNTLGAQKIILGEVTREFGGSAAAIATPGEKMSVAWKNLQETIGLKLLPVISKLSAVLIPVFSFIANNLAVFASLAGFIVAVVGAIKLWNIVQLILNAELTANPIGIIVVAIGVLVAAIYLVATRTKFFQTIWNASWGAIKAAFGAVMGFLRGNLTGLVLLIFGPIGALTYVALHWKMLWHGIETGFHATVGFLRGLLATLVGWILGFFGSIVHGAANAFGWVPGIGGKLKSAARAFDKFKSDVTRSLRGIPDETVHVYVKEVDQFSKGVGNKIKAGALAGIRFRASGGPIPPMGWSVVGEDGAELIRAGSSGATVMSHADSMRASRWTGGGHREPDIHFHFHDSVIASKRAAQDLVKGALDQLVRDRRIVLAKP